MRPDPEALGQEPQRRHLRSCSQDGGLHRAACPQALLTLGIPRALAQSCRSLLALTAIMCTAEGSRGSSKRYAGRRLHLAPRRPAARRWCSCTAPKQDSRGRGPDWPLARGAVRQELRLCDRPCDTSSGSCLVMMTSGVAAQHGAALLHLVAAARHAVAVHQARLHMGCAPGRGTTVR